MVVRRLVPCLGPFDLKERGTQMQWQEQSFKIILPYLAYLFSEYEMVVCNCVAANANARWLLFLKLLVAS